MCSPISEDRPNPRRHRRQLLFFVIAVLVYVPGIPADLHASYPRVPGATGLVVVQCSAPAVRPGTRAVLLTDLQLQRHPGGQDRAAPVVPRSERLGLDARVGTEERAVHESVLY